MEGHWVMSKKGRARMVVTAKITESGMKIGEASDLLGPRYQQTLRIAKRYGAEGAVGLGIAILGAHSPQAKLPHARLCLRRPPTPPAVAHHDEDTHDKQGKGGRFRNRSGISAESKLIAVLGLGLLWHPVVEIGHIKHEVECPCLHPRASSPNKRVGLMLKLVLLLPVAVGWGIIVRCVKVQKIGNGRALEIIPCAKAKFKAKTSPCHVRVI